MTADHAAFSGESSAGSRVGHDTRLLVMAEGVTLAHVGRALRLAQAAHDAGADVVFACDPRFDGFVRHVPYRTTAMESISIGSFVAALDRGAPVFTYDILARYVEADLALLERVRPHAVIGDFRLSLSVSARLAGVPYVNVTNAYWSPYARPDFVAPDIAPFRGWNQSLADAAFRAARPLAFSIHARPMNRLRSKHGLPSFGPDVRRVYCDGDVTLYADVPQLVPVFNAPASHRYVGPVTWSPTVPLPPWWAEATAAEPPIYLSLGSSGSIDLLREIVEWLQPLGCPMIVATAGRAIDRITGSRVWAAEFLPGEVASGVACVVVCNGGSPSTYQALMHGVPVVGIAGNLDQHLNMGYVARSGAGTMLRSQCIDADSCRAAVERALTDAQMRERALGTKEVLQRHTDPGRFLESIAEVLPASIRA